MTEFAPVLKLSSLNGSNGFRLDGVATSDYSGFSVSSAGDVNGDGFADLIIGAPLADPNGDASGASYVIFGKASDFDSAIDLSSLNGSNGFRLDGLAPGDKTGHSVSAAGDVNGDGIDDFIVGASGAERGGSSECGSSYIVFGTASGFTSTFNLLTLNGANGFRFDGVTALDRSGSSVASAGDINGDGFGDVIVGAPGADPNGDSSGSSYVVFGTDAGFPTVLDLTMLNGTNGLRLDGVALGDRSGFSVASAGDINGDGLDDLIIGALDADPNGENSGSSYVVFGRAAGFAPSIQLSTLDGVIGFRLDGAALSEKSGTSVASAGDVNGDGFDDLIIGAFDADHNRETDSGSAYVVFGRSLFASTVQLSSLNGSNGFRLDGLRSEDFAGYSVHGAGDVNGDGFADLVISSHGFDVPGASRVGAAYVVFGKASGFASAIDLASLNGNDGFRVEGVAADDIAGVSVSGAGDVNGDGFDDLIIGAYGADPHGGGSGSSYVVFGHRALTDVIRVGTDLDNRINGGFGDDIIRGLSGDDTLIAWEGSDFVYGGSGDDRVVAASGDDAVYGGSGNDRLDGGTGDDTIWGEDDDDRIVASAGNDEVHGGSGRDAFDLSAFKVAVTINLATGLFNHPNGIDVQTFSSIEDVFGGSGRDTIIGDGKDNALLGNSGGDALKAGGGDDLLRGGPGNDTLDGGSGIDTGDFSDKTRVVTVTLNGATAVDVTFGGSTETDSMKNIENVAGGSADDRLRGDSLANLLLGNGGKDTLTGAAGNDTLDGGARDDLLFGGAGADRLTGGTGADRFVYTALGQSTPGAEHDTITGFSELQNDKIDLAAIDAIAGNAEPNDPFTFIGSAKFTAAGQLRFGSVTHLLQGNVDGDLAPDIEILIDTPTFTANDFIDLF